MPKSNGQCQVGRAQIGTPKIATCQTRTPKKTGRATLSGQYVFGFKNVACLASFSCRSPNLERF